MFQLEKYRGLKSRFTCPSCQTRNVFARYINTDTNEHLSPEVGRCNRESNCGYHYSPKDYFRDNPSAEFKSPKIRKNNSPINRSSAKRTIAACQTPDYIEFECLRKTLANYEQNSFVQFLFDLFHDDADSVREAVKKYLIGTTRDGRTVFWQIDRCRKIRTGKILAYDASTGKRRKDVFPSWAHAELKRAGLLKHDFNLEQCFFGEYLSRLHPDKPIAIVEAEKTAVIASMCFPEFLWLAAGAKQNLKAGKLKRLGYKPIILYPDGDGFKQWQEVAQDARKLGLTVNVSALIENSATSEQKANGYDLADYLIEEQRRINEHNAFVDRQLLVMNHTLVSEYRFH